MDMSSEKRSGEMIEGIPFSIFFLLFRGGPSGAAPASRHCRATHHEDACRESLEFLAHMLIV